MLSNVFLAFSAVLVLVSGFTRAQCLGQWWIHALRQSRLLLEDSPPVTQFSVTGREQLLLPVSRELSSLGKRSLTRASCPCLMKHNSLSHLSGRRFLPSVAGEGLPLWHNDDFFDGCHSRLAMSLCGLVHWRVLRLYLT